MNKPFRNNGIDLLRGISIFLVILLHFNIHFKLRDTFIKELLPKELFIAFFISGYYGVILFFTISGYLITLTILKRYQTLDNINIKEFYWFRFSRIFPPLLSLLLILTLLDITGAYGFTINEERTTLLRALFAALTFHVNLLEINVGYLPGSWDVLWTISVEEIYYLVFPILCRFIKNKWVLMALLIGTLIISPWSRANLFVGNELGMKNNLNYLDCIGIGCCIAVLVQNFSFKKINTKIMALMGGMIVLFMLFFRPLFRKTGLGEFGLDVTILITGVALLLIWMHFYFVHNEKKIRYAGWITEMGKYSYEIYLTHMFVITCFATIYKHFQLSQSYIPLLLPLSVALSYYIGKIVFHTFSEPLNQKLREYRKNKFSSV